MPEPKPPSEWGPFRPVDPFRRCPVFEREGHGRYWIPDGKGYRTKVACAIDLGKVDLPYYRSDLHGFCIIGRTLYVRNGLWWDGATLALDFKSHLASLVHDCLCWAADDGHRHSGTWRQTIFTDICRAQGMNGLVCAGRWLMLQTFGRIYQAL